MRKWMMFAVLLVCLALPAGAGGSALWDEAGLLSAGEAQALEARAVALAETYDFGIYLVTVPDTGGRDAYAYATALFQDWDLGYGGERNGVILLLSMAQREYALAVHGAYGRAAFTAYGQDKMTEAFLEDFGNDQWYAGFSSYLDSCETYLAAAGEGRPIGQNTDAQRHGALMKLAGAAAVGLVAAGVTLGIFWARMHTARTPGTAAGYETQAGLQLTQQLDIFTHRTESRRVIPSENANGQRHHSGGGFSGKRGKF